MQDSSDLFVIFQRYNESPVLKKQFCYLLHFQNKIFYYENNTRTSWNKYLETRENQNERKTMHFQWFQREQHFLSYILDNFSRSFSLCFFFSQPTSSARIVYPIPLLVLVLSTHVIMYIGFSVLRIISKQSFLLGMNQKYQNSFIGAMASELLWMSASQKK